MSQLEQALSQEPELLGSLYVMTDEEIEKMFQEMIKNSRGEEIPSEIAQLQESREAAAREGVIL